MAETSQFVIQYLADISQVKKEIKKLQSINKNMSSQLGQDFSRAVDIVDRRIKSIRTKPIFSKKLGRDVIKTFAEVETVFKTVDGRLRTLRETTVLTSKGFKLLRTSAQGGIKSLSELARAQARLNGQSSQLATNFKNLNNVNRTFANQLRGSGKATKLLGTSLDQVSNTGSKVSKIFETTNGKFVKLTQTVTKLPNGIQKVTRSVQQMSKAQALNAKVLERSNATTKTLGQNFTQLAKRALLTIPIWFALRGAIFGLFRTIRDGLKNIASFDLALQRLRKNIAATSSDIKRDFSIAQKAIFEFSLKSGKSVEEITDAVQKFATVGFDMETSLKAGIQATKLSVVLFGDGAETAEAFSRALRVIVGTSKPIADQQREIGEALAFTSQLWDTNQFNIKEVNQALGKFAPVAKTTNLSMKETLTLLATLGTAAVGGARGGTLLRTSLQKLLENLDDVGKVLGVKTNPALDTTFTTLLKVVDASAKLGSSFEAVVERSQIMSKVFGGIRGSLPIQALTALNDKLKENAALIPDVGKLEAEFERQNKQINRLVERHKNLNKEMGKAFVTGILGAGNYQKGLLAIVETQQTLIDDTERLGQVLRDAILVGGVASLVIFNKQILTTLALLATPIGLAAVAGFGLLTLKAELERFDREVEKLDQEFSSIGKNLAERINKGFEGGLTLEALNDLITDLETFGQHVGLDEVVFAKTLTILKEIRKEEQKIVDIQEKSATVEEKNQINKRKSQKISEIVLKNELEILKARGALASQITKAEQLLRKQLGIEKTGLDLLTDQLRKEREINEERRLRSELGSETIKLFRIAQTEGIEVARKIGDVLAKNMDFATFVRIGGKSLEVFKDKFADIFEQQQALAFFKGDVTPGLKGLRGGRRIAIEEEALRVPVRQFNINALLQQKTLENALARLNIPEQTVNAGVVNLNMPGNIETLRQLFQAGEAITGQGARTIFQEAVTQQRASRQIIDLNLNIDGRNFAFQGTPESARILAREITTDPNVLSALENQIVNALDNPQSKISKGVDQRIDQF